MLLTPFVVIGGNQEKEQIIAQKIDSSQHQIMGNAIAVVHATSYDGSLCYSLCAHVCVCVRLLMSTSSKVASKFADKFSSNGY